ncbi:MAG: hypothetical protein R3182_15505, partial [Draconibacterium sp.]|nr:hypothetical protein [Draconibacterium sp.]
FGFNYVEFCQVRDYPNSIQDYGGFNLLNEKQKEEILDLVFGEEGLQVEIVKMFHDPWHQESPESKFDHESTTENMREFVQGGLKRNNKLEIITTLYGPPAWATKQKHIGGRDLDQNQVDNLCKYMTDWVAYLKENGYPVKYYSLHNEGEDFYRWNYDDALQRLEKFDYNMYWPPEQVNQFLKILPKHFKEAGIYDVKVTNGEPSNWTRFYNWGYTLALINDEEAMDNLGLLTTHGFINGDYRKLSHAYIDGRTTSLLRSKKPNLKIWITSYSWADSGTEFIKTAFEHIYTAKVNAIIPWAGIQNPSKWIGGDPNLGTAIRVNDDGSYELTSQYYFYKQLTTAGFRGMSVAHTMLANPVAFIIAFGNNGSEHPDAFVVTSNTAIWKLPLEIKLKGTSSKRFKAFRSSEDGTEKFKEVGVFKVENGSIIYDPPKGTTTTFIAIN